MQHCMGRRRYFHETFYGASIAGSVFASIASMVSRWDFQCASISAFVGLHGVFMVFPLCFLGVSMGFP